MAKDNGTWWEKRVGRRPEITVGEKTQIAPGSNEAKYLYAQEKQDAMRLIQLGNQNNDLEMKRIGQARLRILEGRGTAEDYELLDH